MKKNLDKKGKAKKPPLEEKVTNKELTEKDLDRVTGGVGGAQAGKYLKIK